MITLRFMSISTKPWTVLKEVKVANTQQALFDVTEFYSKEGFSNFKIVDEGDGDGGRITARTPGGRGGRNVAFFDYDYE